MIRTGIYGGSFNPIHTGHTTLGSLLCRQGYLEELWFMVSPHNPLKNEAELLPDEARLALARLAVHEDKRLTVSDFEFHLPRPSFMANTLKSLRETYPTRQFVLVIGADNWLNFHRWYHPQDILNHHEIIVYPRPGYNLQAETLPTGVTLVNTPLIDISSTHLRQLIAQGKCTGEYLSPEVWREIQAKQYYI